MDELDIQSMKDKDDKEFRNVRIGLAGRVYSINKKYLKHLEFILTMMANNP